MQLVRNTALPESAKNLCAIPAAAKNQGIFFALAGANDLPGFHVSADLNYLLKHGKVWVAPAGTQADWQELTSVKSLPKFTSKITDNYDSCSFSTVVSPWMPQFFFEPDNSFRGNKLFKKLK